MRIQDTFDRADTTSGLGTVPGTALAYQISGAARISGNKPIFTTSIAQRPAAVVNTGLATADVTIQAGGGDAIYLRWVDANNWGVGVRLRQYSQVVSYPVTQYKWIADYGNGVGGLSPNTNSHNHADIQTAWSSSQTASPFASSYSHTHSVYDGTQSQFVIGHSHPRVGSGNPTGETQQTTSTTSVTRYEVIVEQNVNGSITTLGRFDLAQLGSLRARVRGTTLEVWAPGATLTLAATAHTTATSHGFGRGPSDANTTRLDAWSLDTLNDAPYAPRLISPANGDSINRSAPLVFLFEHLDPNGGAQSGYDFRTRHESTTTWQPTEHKDSPLGAHEVPANAFPIGRWIWQVRTYDQDGTVGSWSSDGFFNAADPVITHSILSPVSGAIIPTSEFLVEWSSPAQTAYQLRVVPQGGAASYDTGRVAQSDARSALVPFPTNNVTVQIQLRIEHNGIWGPFAISTNTVSWLGPLPPVAQVRVDQPKGAISIQAVNPVAVHPRPIVVEHYVEREKATMIDDIPVFVGDWERLTLRPEQVFPPNGTYIDWEVGSGAEHRYRLVAVGANGTTTPSEPVAENWTPPGTYAFDTDAFDPNAFDVGFADEDDLPTQPAATGFGLQPFGTSPFGG